MTYILNTSPQLTIPPRTIAQYIPQWAGAVSCLLNLTVDTEHKDSAHFHMDILTPWLASGTVIEKQHFPFFTRQRLTAIGKYRHWQRYNTQNIDFPLWSAGSLCPSVLWNTCCPEWDVLFILREQERKRAALFALRKKALTVRWTETDSKRS